MGKPVSGIYREMEQKGCVDKEVYCKEVVCIHWRMRSQDL